MGWSRDIDVLFVPPENVAAKSEEKWENGEKRPVEKREIHSIGVIH